MSQLQIALLTLEQITYMGGNVGTNFTFNFTVAGESVQFPMVMPPGSIMPMSENLGGIERDPSLAPHTMPVNVSITGPGTTAAVSGGASTFLSIASASTQVFNMNVTVGSGVGATATFKLTYRATWRDYPVSYNPEWLCTHQYEWAAFGRWLCIGADQFSDFYTKSSIVSLGNVFTSYAPKLQRIGNDLALGLSPSGSGFLALQQFTFDVVQGAARSISTLPWGRRYTIDDFSEQVVTYVEPYMVEVHTLIDFQVIELCQRWRELLDCFCRFCVYRSTLPTTAVNYYDTNIAGDIDALYLQVKPRAQSEGMPSSVAPSNPSINCDKLRYIVSFWAWYCRRCPLAAPAWGTTLDSAYSTLYDKKQLLNDILEANNYTLCNPPEKNFCTRWSTVLTCLKKLCSQRASLPSGLVNDVESSFGSYVRSLATFLGLPGISGLLGAGISNTCQLLDKVKAYFDKLCSQNVVPASHIRRTQLDTMLAQFESAMSGFTTRNGDLCSASVPMTHCTDWMPILDCLKNICAKKGLLTDAIRAEVLADFTTVIDDLLAIAFPTPPTPPSGASGIDLLCFKIDQLWSFFNARCPNGTIDPILKLRLEAKLADLQAARDQMLEQFEDLCDSSTSITQSWCDAWTPILECLKRICDRSGSLNGVIMADFDAAFGPIIDKLVWASEGAPGSQPSEQSYICDPLEGLISYFGSLCVYGTIDPILKAYLDEVMDDLQSAYNLFLTSYPGLCAEPDPFCEGWIEVLDCMVRLCDRAAESPADPLLNGTLDLAVTRLGFNVDVAYSTIFGGIIGSYPTPRDKFCQEVHKLLDWFKEHCACCGGTVDSNIRIQLGEIRIVIQLEFQELVACDPACTSSSLSLVTGQAPWMVTRVDNLTLATPRTPHIVTDPFVIGDPVSGSDWISPHESASDNVVGVTTFKRCFCVCTAGTIRIQMTYLADDTADIYLDSTLVHSATTQNMHAPESVDVTLTVGPGRHCIRAEVTNDPEYNMAFSATGSVSGVTATLLADECCGDEGHPLPPCSDIPVPCDRVVMLPRLVNFLCCTTRQVNDPFYSNQAYLDIVSGLSCFDGQIGLILLAMGELPTSIPLEGSDVCAHLRRAVRVMFRAYTSFGSLPAHLRLTIDCFYDLLRRKVSDLAATELSNPLPCDGPCRRCEEWLDLLGCLCRFCTYRPRIAASHPSLASQIDQLLCFEQSLAAPAPLGTSSGYYCCNYLVSSFEDLFGVCFCCSGGTATLDAYDASYDWLHASYVSLRDAFAAVGLAPCDDPCKTWMGMIECLVKVCLRRAELPQELRDSFDTLFTSRVAALYADVFGVSAPASPFPAGVMGTTCWSLFQLLRRFSWLCSPLYAWDATLVSALAARLGDFSAAYATFTTGLATAGIGICTEPWDLCGRLERMPELFGILCATTPSPSAPAVVALEALLAQLRPELPNLRHQLGLPATTYPPGPEPPSASFCERLEYVIGIMAAARARYDELARTNQALVDLFFAVFVSQAEVYALTIGSALPRPATPMTDYRDQWMELLSCICRACDLVAGFSDTERVGYASIVAYFDGTDLSLRTAIDDLYARLVSVAGSLSVPFVSDSCADTLCERVRQIMAFFIGYGLRVTDPAPALVAQLETALDPLRAATVALRGAMQRAGRVVCSDENTENVVLQSESLYLQAAGSVGSATGGDGSSAGVHLRWALLNQLGEHLPKGSLAGPGTDYYGTNPFNRQDDYVKVFKAPYGPNQRFPLVIDLTTMVPSSITGSNADGVTWTFNDVPYDPTFSDAVTTVQISFEAGKYGWAIPNPPTLAHVQTVRQGYQGVYRVETILKLMFAVEVDISNPGAFPSVRFETISRNDDPASDEVNFLSARAQVSGSANPHRVVSEAIEYVLFSCVSCLPTVIRLETFDDFHASARRRYLWSPLTRLGLTLDDTEVYRRIEDPGKYTIDGTWPKFSTDPTRGVLMRARAINYQDRWVPRRAPVANPSAGIYNRPVEQSLRAAVVKYLDKSKDWWNVAALSTEKSIMAGDTTEMKLSLLELLQLGAQDYHIARMLGLGAIDWKVTDSTKRYIYMAEYEAPEPLEAQRSTAPQAPTVHRYLSLPTGQTDSRLPVVPTLKAIAKGLEEPFTNTEGYTRYGTYRYIRLFRNDLTFDMPVTTFFERPTTFGRGTQSRPILFGVRYGSMTASNGTPEWAVPDPSNDASETAGPDYHPYVDNDGRPEVVPIPDLAGKDGQPAPALFTHRIKRSDEAKPWHRYALYGINWFSRPSSTTTLSEVFKNEFPVLNTLQPPLNLKAQYLQREDVPLLNAPSENNVGYFKKTRVTFDWNHFHDLAYHFADEVHLYARISEPRRIRGKITTVELVGTSPEQAWVTTGPYQEHGMETTETITPALDPADVSRYLGSLLVTPSNRFEIVEAVSDAGNSGYAKFRIMAVNVAGEDGKMESGTPVTPREDELFLVVENFKNVDDLHLGLPDWYRLDGHKIKLVQFPPHTEAIVTEGREDDVLIGGLVHTLSQVVAQPVAGVYQVTMPGVSLGVYNDHVSNPAGLDISFYKGTFRVLDPLDTTKRRSLEVLKIVSTGPDLTLMVFDPENRLLAGGGTSPMWGNFHPSYRIYVEWETGEGIDPVASFEPVAPELSRITYMTAKAVDSTRLDGGGAPYRSDAAQPAVHLARQVQDLLPPAAPEGPDYASRPDFYGKASYTFDTAIDTDHLPYGMVFYRADEMAVLGALYRMSTITDQILPHLPEFRADDPHLEERWRDLIDVNLDGGGLFKDYGDGFRFPSPDKALEAGYHGPYELEFNGTKSPSEIVEKIKDAIRAAFLPLTESYVVYDQIGESSTLQTSSKKPVLRGPDGQLLDQSIPAQKAMFDPYPMIRKTPTSDPNRKIRFTDYTLDGASRSIYFYFSREVSSGLAAGEASGVKGPVRLVNTFPPVAPSVALVRAMPANAALETSPEVLLRFNPPPAGERIRQIWIYRAEDEPSSRSIRMMKRLEPIVLDEDLPTDAQFDVRDTFTDLQAGESIPFGQPIYYRVVVARRITNENGLEELVPSHPSESVMVSLMDTINPVAPSLEVDAVEVMAPVPDDDKVLKLTDVVISWEAKTYNATYRLYKLSPLGQWTLVKTFAPPQPGSTIVYDWSADHPATTENPENPNLLKLVDGREIYHRFKVVVTNSSGLVSLNDEVKIV